MKGASNYINLIAFCPCSVIFILQLDQIFSWIKRMKQDQGVP